MNQTSRVLAADIELQLPRWLYAGRVEHFAGARSLVLFDPEETEPLLLTVPSSEAPEAHATLADDQVLLRNWTDLRGMPELLQDAGLVELTGNVVEVGAFRLQALEAKVL